MTVRRAMPAAGSGAALAALILACVPAGAAEAWQRSWTVERVLCPGCDAAALDALRRGAVGQQVTLDPERFENPFYESCGGGVDYTDLRPRPRAEAEASLRPGPSVPVTGDAAVAGAVRCAVSGGPPNTVARFVFDGGTGYYLFEGGAVMVLR
jgi:hypothetical protein